MCVNLGSVACSQWPSRQVDGLQKALGKTSDDLASVRVAASENDTTLRRERAASEAVIRGEHADVISQTSSLHTAAVAAMRAEQERIVEETDGRYALIVEQYADLKGRFDNRASRDEDLQKIAELEGFIQHKENEMAAMASHQSQMKAEMMNREQNFTQVRSPPGPGSPSHPSLTRCHSPDCHSPSSLTLPDTPEWRPRVRTPSL